jgi:hypothetical protein
VDGQRHAPAALPPGKTGLTLYRRLGGSQGRSRRVRKISPPPEFDPRAVQPVASRYTDCAIPTLVNTMAELKNVTYTGALFSHKHTLPDAIIVEYSYYICELDRSINFEWAVFGLCHYCIQ